MRKNWMVLSLLAVALSAWAASAAVDFSGTWNLNQDKSTLPEQGGRFGASAKLVITQEANLLTTEREGRNRNGETMTTKESVSLDGKETESEQRGMARTAKATWSKDGKTLNTVVVRSGSRNGNAFVMTTTEIWTLSADGKTLTIDSTTESPRGERKMKLVYNKA